MTSESMSELLMKTARAIAGDRGFNRIGLDVSMALEEVKEALTQKKTAEFLLEPCRKLIAASSFYDVDPSTMDLIVKLENVVRTMMKH